VLTFSVILYNMAIQRKADDECSSVMVDLCGEAKAKVLDKQKEMEAKGFPRPGKALAIIKLILGK